MIKDIPSNCRPFSASHGGRFAGRQHIGSRHKCEHQTANFWGSGVRISSGAPLSYLRTVCLIVLASQNSLLKHVLAALDPYLPVFDLDDVDERLRIEGG